MAAIDCDHIDRLPEPLLLLIAEWLSPVNLLSLALVSRRCRAAAEDEPLWRALLDRHLRPMAVAFFEGTLPSPPTGMK